MAEKKKINYIDPLADQLETHAEVNKIKSQDYTPEIWSVALMKATQIAARKTFKKKDPFVAVPIWGYGRLTLDQPGVAASSNSETMLESQAMFLRHGLVELAGKLEAEAIRTQTLALLEEYPVFAKTLLRNCKEQLRSILPPSEFAKLYVDKVQLVDVLTFFLHTAVQLAGINDERLMLLQCQKILLQYVSKPQILAQELCSSHKQILWKLHR